MRRVLIFLAWFAFVLSIVVVVLGAYTRLKDAGLGCPDWPGCYGHWDIPQQTHELDAANRAYPDRPVVAEKAWTEMVHRYVAGVLGVLILLLNIVGWKSTLKDRPTKHLAFLLFLVVFQAALGMWTVTWNLLPLVVTLHLVGGFTTMALLFLLALRFRRRDFLGNRLRTPAMTSLSMLAWFGLVVIVFQVLLGGWTSSNYAALVCPDFPTCQGSWLPEMDFIKGFDLTSPIGPDYQGGKLELAARTAIHWSHRLFALVVFVVVGFLGLKARRFYDNGISSLGRLILAVLGIQVALGVSNVVYGLPLSVAVLHNAGAAFLILSVIALLFVLHRKKGGV